MAVYRAEKIVASLPDPLAPNTVYYVRTGEGFDLYVSDSTGSIAHQLNQISVLIGTRQAILSTPAGEGAGAFATDTSEAFTYINGGWQQGSESYTARQGPVDMGAHQDSNLAGYGPDYVTDKTLSNVAIGGNTDPREGAIRRQYSAIEERNLLQAYLSGGWQTVLTGVTIQAADNDIVSTDFAPWVLSLITGHSERVALDGTPIVKGMQIDMGAYSSDVVIDGGSF